MSCLCIGTSSPRPAEPSRPGLSGEGGGSSFVGLLQWIVKVPASGLTDSKNIAAKEMADSTSCISEHTGDEMVPLKHLNFFMALSSTHLAWFMSMGKQPPRFFLILPICELNVIDVYFFKNCKAFLNLAYFPFINNFICTEKRSLKAYYIHNEGSKILWFKNTLFKILFQVLRQLH